MQNEIVKKEVGMGEGGSIPATRFVKSQESRNVKIAYFQLSNVTLASQNNKDI